MKEYIAYRCSRCKSEIILLTKDMLKNISKRYIACSYCGNKKLNLLGEYDDLKEAIKAGEIDKRNIDG